MLKFKNSIIIQPETESTAPTEPTEPPVPEIEGVGVGVAKITSGLKVNAGEQ